MTAPTFAEAFPSVASIEVEIEIRRGGPLDERPQRRYYSVASITREPVKCNNPLCHGGGWSVWDAVRDVVEKRERQTKRGGVCQGSERMNRTNSRTCLALFQANISVVYQ